MICSNKQQYELCLREYKNFAAYAWDLVDTYKSGSEAIGVKKNLKKAIDILKYWEKNKNIMMNNYFINYLQAELYKELGKEKISDEYYKTYYLYEIKLNDMMQTKNLAEIYRNLFLLDFKYAINQKNGKIADKKLLSSMLNYFDLFICNVEKTNDLYFEKNFRNKLIEFFKDGEYKKMFFIHILEEHYRYYNSKDSIELIKKFEKEDFEVYLKILNNSNFLNLKEFTKNLKIYYDFHFSNCDEKVKLDYANAISLDKNFFVKDSSIAVDIYKDCYNNGSKKAIKLLLDLYDRNKKYKDAHKFLEGHIKKHPTDKKIKLLLADFYIKDSYTNKAVFNINLFKKALKIYETNNELLSDEQSNLVSTVYAEGICVEVDLEKAKLYSKSERTMQLVEKQEIKAFNNLKFKDKSFTLLIKDLMEGFESLNGEKLDRLFNIIDDGYIVFKDEKLMFKLANFMERNNIPEGLYDLYYCYVFGLGVKADMETARKYQLRLLEMENKYGYYANSLEYATNIKDAKKALEFLNKAVKEDYYPALLTLANSYYEGKLVEEDKEKAYKLYKKLYELGYLDKLKTFAVMYKSGKYDDYDDEKYYEILKTIADNTNNPTVCYLLYEHNLNINKLSQKEAINYLVRAAENGNNDAIKKLIIDNRNTNEKEYYKWVLKGHEINSEYANIELADLYYFGNDKLKVSVDEKKAFELYKNNSKGNNYVNLMLGRCYYNGHGTKVNYKKAFEFLTDSYNKGLKNSAIYLANCYRFGNGVEVDYKKAYSLYKEASTLGPYYLVEYANCYVNGLGDYLPCDLDKAITLYKKAIKESERPYFYHKLGIAYAKKFDFKNAIDCFEKIIKLDNKNIDAYRNLGIVYKHSNNLDRDYNKSLEYFKKALELGDSKSNLNIAEIYIYNNYGFNDIKSAEPYLLKAYEEKVEGADVLLAYMYERKKDEKKAYEIIKDVEEDSVLKDCVLGNLYYSGKFLRADYNKAFMHYQKAYEVDKEDPYIWFRLGRCYYFGHGVERDTNRAYDFISLAKNKDFIDAIQFYDEYFNK